MPELKSQEVGYDEPIASASSDSILPNYFRMILSQIGVDVTRFPALLDRYIVRKHRSFTTNELATARSALQRELMSQSMTWKVFLKGLLFLRVKHVVMQLQLYREPLVPSDDIEEETSVHELVFDLKDDVLALNADEDSEDVSNELADFFRTIRTDLYITDNMFQGLLDHYVKTVKAGSNAMEQYTHKCSLRREIMKSSISWKVFIKSLIFLKTKRAALYMELFHANGAVTQHVKILVFR